MTVSLCVIAYNEECFLPNLLEDLLNQTYPHSMTEIVLVDGKSEDKTKEIIGNLKPGEDVAIFIGPEGGFSEKEIETARALGFKTVSLGKRILRTETAAITAVGMCMLYSEMNLGDN